MSNNPPIEAFRRCVNCGSSGQDVTLEWRWRWTPDPIGPDGIHGAEVNICADEPACRQRWAWRFGQTKRGA